MPDRKNFINQFEADVKRAEQTGEMFVYVGQKTAKNVLALLKEQEAVEPIRINTNYEQSWKCGKCGGLVNTHFKYCPSCGQAVKWE